MVVINFFLNGQIYFSTQILTLVDIINYFNYSNELFVIEYNTFICPQENWDKIYINNFDKIEIITVVGGG